MTTYLKWDAPTTGPRPDGYEIFVDGFFYNRTDKTEIAIPGRDAETDYVVFSYRIASQHPDGDEYISSFEPCKLTIGHRITSIDIRDNGVILSFPTRIGSMYTVEKATDLNGPWTEIARFMAAMDVSRVGGDPLQERAVYRAWRIS